MERSMLHIQIRHFKNWLRAEHSYCDKKIPTKLHQRILLQVQQKKSLRIDPRKTHSKVCLFRTNNQKRANPCDLNE